MKLSPHLARPFKSAPSLLSLAFLVPHFLCLVPWPYPFHHSLTPIDCTLAPENHGILHRDFDTK